MADETKIKVKTEPGGSFGLVWVMGWLFTIGYLHLPVAKALYAIVIWPYYIGVAIRR
jgi:hypothetical protein